MVVKMPGPDKETKDIQRLIDFLPATGAGLLLK